MHVRRVWQRFNLGVHTHARFSVDSDDTLDLDNNAPRGTDLLEVHVLAGERGQDSLSIHLLALSLPRHLGPVLKVHQSEPDTRDEIGENYRNVTTMQ